MELFQRIIHRLSADVIMKDFHWFIVLGAILITPFLPMLLRSQCPSCKKRKLNSLDTVKIHAEDQASGFTYVALYRCDSCHALFKRTRSGALQPSSSDEHKMLAEAAVKEVRA